MRVLVLGGTHFVGPWIVRSLAAAGHDVTVFHRGTSEADLPPSVRHVHGDFAAFGEHVDGLRLSEPQVVLDTVPYMGKAGHGVAHFAGVAERAVVLTSGDVYRAFARLLGSEPGPPDPVPLTEDAPLRQQPSPDLGADIDYDNVDVERAVGVLEFPVTVLRLPVVYGPHDPQNRLGEYVGQMLDGRSAILLEEQLAGWRWSREYVENVGAAIALAVNDPHSAGRVYNVAPEPTLTERAWVEAIADVIGWEGEVVVAPARKVPEMDLRQDLVMDSSRIREELGFSPPVALRDGLQRTVDWSRRLVTELR